MPEPPLETSGSIRTPAKHTHIYAGSSGCQSYGLAFGYWPEGVFVGRPARRVGQPRRSGLGVGCQLSGAPHEHKAVREVR